MADLNLTVSVIILNINELSTPNKRQELAKWIKKILTQLCPIYKKTHLIYKDTKRLKTKKWKKIYHANNSQKRDEMAILISDQIKTKIVTREKEKHFPNNKEANHQEDIIITGIPWSYCGFHSRLS